MFLKLYVERLVEAKNSWRKPNSVVIDHSQGKKTIVKDIAIKKPFSGTMQQNLNSKLPKDGQSVPKKKNAPFYNY
jgi:hypothetical protein